MYKRRMRRRITRRPRRRRTMKRRTTRIARPIRGVGPPKQMYAKLPYDDALSSAVTAGSYVSWVYQSSAYDPYQPAGGHQPLWFDQYAAMYQRYTVLGISYSMDVSGDYSNAVPFFCVAYPQTSSSPVSTVSYARERTGATEVIASSQFRARLKGYVSCAKVFGVNKRKLLDDDQYSALVSTNPTQLAYLIIQVFNPSAVNGTMYSNLRLMYYIRFFDPTDPAQS